MRPSYVVAFIAVVSCNFYCDALRGSCATRQVCNESPRSTPSRGNRPPLVKPSGHPGLMFVRFGNVCFRASGTTGITESSGEIMQSSQISFILFFFLLSNFLPSHARTAKGDPLHTEKNVYHKVGYRRTNFCRVFFYSGKYYIVFCPLISASGVL